MRHRAQASSVWPSWRRRCGDESGIGAVGGQCHAAKYRRRYVMARAFSSCIMPLTKMSGGMWRRYLTWRVACHRRLGDIVWRRLNVMRGIERNRHFSWR